MSFIKFLTFKYLSYNVLTDHGPDLYGTEPASFYLFNGLLNFNFVFPAALATLPLRYALAIIFGEKNFPTRGKLLPVWLSQVNRHFMLKILKSMLQYDHLGNKVMPHKWINNRKDVKKYLQSKCLTYT